MNMFVNLFRSHRYFLEFVRFSNIGGNRTDRTAVFGVIDYRVMRHGDDEGAGHQ